MRRVPAAILCVAMLAGAEAAQADERFASPGGSGTACSADAPCDLKEAVEKAEPNDEVIVNPGSYTVKPTIAVPAFDNVYVHGSLGDPAPRILATSAGAVFYAQSDARLSHLDIAGDQNALSCGAGVRIDRIRATTTGDNAIALSQREDCSVRDSLLIAEGANANALRGSSEIDGATTTGLVRNVTAVASGPGAVAITSEYDELIQPGTFRHDLRNVIAAGTGADLLARSIYTGKAEVHVFNSNFDVVEELKGSTIEGALNQASAPIFANAAAGDYRQAAGSPTIDAGSTDLIGPLDLDGNPRIEGPAPDIGAFEFVPPQPPPPPVPALLSLELSPRAFRPTNFGGAIVSAPGRARRARVGSDVRYELTLPATATFSVEKALPGRKVRGKCRRPTRKNRTEKRCVRFRMLKGSFTHEGTAGRNGFKFSGRIGARALPGGRYRLVAEVGESVRRTPFAIVR
jgi:hypothetical protein